MAAAKRKTTTLAAVAVAVEQTKTTLVKWFNPEPNVVVSLLPCPSKLQLLLEGAHILAGGKLGRSCPASAALVAVLRCRPTNLKKLPGHPDSQVLLGRHHNHQSRFSVGPPDLQGKLQLCTLLLTSLRWTPLEATGHWRDATC